MNASASSAASARNRAIAYWVTTVALRPPYRRDLAPGPASPELARSPEPSR